MSTTRQIHIKLGPDLHAALKARALEDDRSVQNTVVRALRQYLGIPQKSDAVRGRPGVRTETRRGGAR
jgi:hypothetical protein